MQWYEHASKTYLKEISDPQELFLCPLCGTIDLLKGQVLGKVKVQPFRPDRTRGVSTLMSTEFFSEYVPSFVLPVLSRTRGSSPLTQSSPLLLGSYTTRRMDRSQTLRLRQSMLYLLEITVQSAPSERNTARN